ncbi:DUF2935 domain-containing protein [Evansella cellulosilytica]|uniref:DUF2935 domain-containing protein n=1 Tax=Evansella cellulosilytica (strain ATCC 21833 / DSM 2522 / FERM P-1141 / JCM 9156 / N-4) TaxID=649639 RepID=E6TY84_EVAC2|nr:DUF2935 domain-containing protein [Evansella cellulosilytica]ADU32403.1 hypothetical protein Bcell_4176 [Evansella cellulosilytica DSM 2522]
MAKHFRNEAFFELKFWLQVLGDHGRFIHDSLAPSEEEYIKQAKYFIRTFDTLLEEARKSLNDQQLMQLLQRSNEEGNKLRELKLSIIKEHLVGDVKISLPPSFLNHMVNELDEFLRLLSYLVKGQVPPDVHPLHHDLIWLLDAAGHANAIHDDMDHVEYNIRHRSEQFTKEWEEFYLKAVEMAGYLRANVTHFPALSKMHKDIKLEMELFKAFLREVEEMELNKESLGVFEPLMADHMLREECYYLMKLADTTELAPPDDCDPTKPRLQD